MSNAARKVRQQDDVLNFAVRELDHLSKQETDIVEKVFKDSGKNTKPELIIEPMQKEISKVAIASSFLGQQSRVASSLT